ncbi:fungal-specific transcription factor domain protein [Penicillium frequentans]|uniref:Fungal-specific transcription factor domain protein n=1 Tax=Penicillium frequentans TaxID=3151616 RepID=A0AAD6CLY7_9EURO|nr:fungal-specific transcription factor domain protein [Penicillium glabrum]
MPTAGLNIVATDDQMESSSRIAPRETPQSVYRDPGVAMQLSSIGADSMLPSGHVSVSKGKDHETSPAPSPASSEYGSMRPHSHGAEYVGSAHWAAVLDSISELKDHYEEEEEARMLVNNDRVPYRSPGPLLLYQPVNVTKAEILASIPARPVVDRMVARYFFLRDTAPLPVLHNKQFLAEYESFWQDPTSVPLLWIGLLFSVMALTMQYQQLIEDPADPETISRVQMFRERTINCLILGEFTRGKEYVIETLLHHLTLEVLLCKDADIGVWLALGILVQLALSLGYHRDPQKFPKISAFAGEMRRRIWAVVVQTDLRLSSQMGFPRLLKLHQCDTAEPSNLLDSDFDETTTELPPSRPETEVTPTLSILAKNRIDHMSGLVSDFLADTREHSYSEIMALDSKLDQAEDSLPPIFKWQPLSQSLMVPPHIIMQRVWLQLAIPRLKIWLHRKFLVSYHQQTEYEYSRNVCVKAGMKILEFQKLLDEETRPDGLLCPVRWMMTSLSQFVFLHGMSILAYYVQLSKTRPDISMDEETQSKIYSLLRDTYPIWLRSSIVSREARQAVKHLGILLGLQGEVKAPAPLLFEDNAEAGFDATQFESPSNMMPFDQFAWEAYQECLASFPSPSGFGTELLGQPGGCAAVKLRPIYNGPDDKQPE